jgi:hypothetical protein
MISEWHQHLKTEEEKARFKNSVLGSKVVLDRLDEILLKIKDDTERLERNTDTYSIPNWDYRQAHVNGFMDCLHKVRKIINLDQQAK